MPGGKISLQKALPYIFIVGGLVGLVCAFILTIDAFNIAKNPAAQLNCNLNPVIACGPVITAKEAEAFNFPNPFLGLAAFAALLTVGLAMLAGAAFKRWFWLGLEVGALAGLGFIAWLFYESVYKIGALCPYCMVVWVVVITTFWYITLYNVEQGFIRLPAGIKGIERFVRRYNLFILIVWLLVIAALILQHFWYYYGRYF